MHAKNFQDLTGMIFGDYEVVREAPSKFTPKGKINTMWHVRCIKCGYEKDTAANHIKNRPNTCPNCSRKTTFEDLTGKIFGYLKVISRAPGTLKSNGKFRTMWNCICLLCGRTTIIPAADLKSGRRISDGCLKGYFTSKSKLKDYTGQQVGRLLVKEQVEDWIGPSGKKDRQWMCVCSCGEICFKTTTYLRTSPCASCGCWKSEIISKIKTKNIIGLIFGQLLVLKKVRTKYTTGGNSKIVYLCKCLNCGNEVEVIAGNLMNGSAKSCGCIKSFGEHTTRTELINRNIKFKTQFYFNDLYLSSSQHPLLFDFAIFDINDNLQFLIEYQGKQHYEFTNKDGTFGQLQRDITDSLKKEYCAAHNIALYEIRYNENISDAIEKILTTHVNFVPSSD